MTSEPSTSRISASNFSGRGALMIQRRTVLVLLAFSFLWLGSSEGQHARKAPNATTESSLTLRDGWSLQSSCKVDKPGEVISTPKFLPTGWYTVKVPTTVVAALVAQKVYPDPEFGMNLRSYPGMTYPIGANFSNIPMQQDSPFMVPWWYRKQFVLPEGDRGKTIWLKFGGLNYRANIWLNGKQIGKKEDVAGAWRTWEFNITDAALAGKPNVLAVEVFSPTEKDLAITFVDWNPAPPDKNMGLYRSVEITTSGPVTGPLVVISTLRYRPMFLSGGAGFQSTNVIARSFSVGEKTSTARTFGFPASAASVMLNSQVRQAPATSSFFPICFPLSQILAR